MDIVIDKIEFCGTGEHIALICRVDGNERKIATDWQYMLENNSYKDMVLARIASYIKENFQVKNNQLFKTLTEGKVFKV